MFEWLLEQIKQAKIISKEFEQGWKFRLNPPATKADIDSCDAVLGIPLLPSYREFLLQWNDAHLFYTHESLLPDGNVWYYEGRMFSIQSTHELFDFNQEEAILAMKKGIRSSSFAVIMAAEIAVDSTLIK